jgi:AcrR family transcriptional regulator
VAKTTVKLKVPLPSVPGTSRRISASTKRTLIDLARVLFTENGYASTSLDTIVARAEVTKGALYHHFSGKQALFEAVFEDLEQEAVRIVEQAMRDIKDPWDRAIAGLRTFLTAVQEPSYRRLVIQEGPAVLGYERYREHEERSALAVVQDIIESTIGALGQDLTDEVKATWSRIFMGALSAAGQDVSLSHDPEAAANRVEVILGMVFNGLQSLARRPQNEDDAQKA